MSENALIIDTREPKHLIKAVQERAAEIGIETQLMEMTAGDYVFVYKDFQVGIERKEVSDLLNTMSNDRLRPQIANLISMYQIPYLLIEGQLAESREGNAIVSGRERGWRATAIHAVLFSIQEQHVRIALSSSENATVRRLFNLYDYYAKPDHKDFTNDRFGLFTHLSNPAINILMGVPGIGMDTAKKLLAEFKTVSNVATATELELQQAEKVGPKKAHEIYVALHTPVAQSEYTPHEQNKVA